MTTPSRGIKFGQQNLILLVGALTELKQKNDLSKITIQKLKADLEQALKIYIPDSTIRLTCKNMGITLKSNQGVKPAQHNRFSVMRAAIVELAESLGHLSPVIEQLKNLK